MSIPIRPIGTTLLSAVLSAVVLAQTGEATALKVNLGLWEVTSTSQRSGMLPVDTSKLTPQQQAAVAAMQKSQAQRAPKPETQVTKECITKEKFARPLFMDADAARAQCTQSFVTNTAATYDAKVSCTGQMPISGELHIDALSHTSVKGTMQLGAPGGPAAYTSTFTAKWLGEACGDVK